LLGIYGVLLSEEGEIMRFERKGIRKRGDVEQGEGY